MAGSAARIAGGIGIVACAAVVALAAGGGTVFGGLGGLFGSSAPALQVARGETSAAADIVAAPNAADRAAARRRAALNELSRRTETRSRPHTRRVGTPPPRSTQPVALSPSPSPVPAPPSPAPPTPVPSPGGGQVIMTVSETVKQVTNQAPPQLQPIAQPINDTVDTLVQTCQGLPICP
jgi:hypothetical protein